MRRYILLFISLIIVGVIVVGCSSDDADSAVNEANEETDASDEPNEDAAQTSGDIESLGIELRDHDFDEAEEEIDQFIDHGDGYYSKDGENLTLPEEFPSYFPIPEGMTVEFAIVKEDFLEVGLIGGKDYTSEQMKELYNNYIETDVFDDGGWSEESSLPNVVDVYIGFRDGDEHVIGVSSEGQLNVVSLSIYRE